MRKQSIVNTVLVTATLIACLFAGNTAYAEGANLSGRTLYELGETRDPAKVDQLLAALNTSDHHLRRIAVRALGKIGHEKAVAPLIEILESKDEMPMVKSAAAWALGALKAGEALDSLSCCLKDDSWVCLEARKAILKITRHYNMLASL